MGQRTATGTIGSLRRALVALLTAATMGAALPAPALAADTTPPVVSSAQVTPAPSLRKTLRTATALITDNTGVTGGEVILDDVSAAPVLPVDGAWDSTSEEVTVSLAKVIDIAAGDDATCALLWGGSVECWGWNAAGQLGDGTTNNRPLPTPVVGLEGAVAMSFRTQTGCAVLADGTVWCWGANEHGQLGDGTTTNSSMPAQVQGITNATAIAVGGLHACAILATRHIVCWGNDGAGQLGDGGSVNQPAPVEAIGITTATQIAAAPDHTCAIVEGNLPYCWGANDWMQLGAGETLDPQRTPVAMTKILEVDLALAIFVAEDMTCVRRMDYGTICWGSPYTGLSTGGVVPGLRQVSMGGTACAVLGTLNLTCWGGGTVSLRSPGDLPGAWIVAVGPNHACAETYAGAVSCWGANTRGQLGRGSTSVEEALAPVPGLNGLAPTDTGDHSVCIRGRDAAGNVTPYDGWSCTTLTILPETEARLASLDLSGPALSPAFSRDTTTYTAEVDTYSPSITIVANQLEWHATMAYRTGMGAWTVLYPMNDLATITVPVGTTLLQVQVTAEDGLATTTYTVSLTRVAPDETGPTVTTPVLTPSTISRGGSASVVATISDPSGVSSGEVRIDAGPWKSLFYRAGMAGDASVDLGITFTSAASITAGESHACALTYAGTVTCWGDGGYGQLGQGVTLSSATPVPVDISGVTQVVAGRWHTCALLDDTTVRCWGANEFGELGDYTNTNAAAPVTVVGIDGAGTLTGVVALSGGGYHTCALLASGSVACWGRGDYAELGDDRGADSTVPVLVSGITTATAIAAGDVHSCAVLANGTVQCWGAGNNGRLGTGSYDWAYTPEPVSGLANAVAVAAGGAHTCAMLATGGLSCWGSNALGQLGLDPSVTPETNAPAPVTGVTGVTALRASFHDTCVLRSTGVVSCWGEVATAAPGTGGTTGAMGVAAGGVFACSLSRTGTIACWGDNQAGSLGNGTHDSSASAVVSSTSDTLLADGSHQVCIRATDGPGNVTSPASCATLTIPDVTAPTFTTPVTVTPRAGVTLPTAGATSAIPVIVSWAATDGGVLTKYTLERRTGTGAWTKVALASALATSYATTVPASGTVSFRVTAFDAASHTTISTSAALSARLVQQTATGITRKGTWTPYALGTLSGGSDTWAKAAGATATFTFTGRSIGFVTMRGTGRGYVTIIVDGSTVAKVLLYRSTAQPRYIAWSKALAYGSHTVKLVVAGTAGRPRVDLDAFVTIR